MMGACLSLMLRRARRSTLFPYTTLFRSNGWVPDNASRAMPSGLGCASGALVAQPKPDGDRKSTRLNSSHMSSSYAVFCVKKKNLDDDHLGIAGRGGWFSCTAGRLGRQRV